jgi:hypothetical protein
MGQIVSFPMAQIVHPPQHILPQLLEYLQVKKYDSSRLFQHHFFFLLMFTPYYAIVTLFRFLSNYSNFIEFGIL